MGGRTVGGGAMGGRTVGAGWRAGCSAYIRHPQARVGSSPGRSVPRGEQTAMEEK